MSQIIATSTDRMQTDIDTLQDNLDRMERAFEEAWEALDSLHVTWEGPAHEELIEQFLEDQERMNAMMENLRFYLDEFINAKKEYVTSEGSVYELVSSMNV